MTAEAKGPTQTHPYTPPRLHFGCGLKYLPGWVNIDIVPRIPEARADIDIFHLPYSDGTVQAILAEHLFEHFSFEEESKIWPEVARVLAPNGTLTIEVPDFEWVCRTFLDAKDDWREFYTLGAWDYAGCGRDPNQRWGILQTMFFGNQNGPGQYHKSAYTEGKILALAARLGFKKDVQIERLYNKGGLAIRATLTKYARP